ncbi:MAG: YihA family ribosome biogenesis GTP-binding protein [Clostridiaceae bacterium]|nr:YihA family ribosome biogenesis GTP-binding protein [Clostridiaceae bacterium]
MANGKKRRNETAGIAYVAAASREQFPKPARREIVFAGRSNVGKSTLVNALSKRKNLARTSKTPGKTRLVFFYDVSPDFYFVDLPGYGFARISQGEKEAFSHVTDQYFESDRPVALVLVLIDIRRGFGEADHQMLEYLSHYDIDWQVILTKADKLSRQQTVKAEQEAMSVIRQYAREGRLTLTPLSVSAGMNPRDARMKLLEERITELTGGAFASI